MSFNAQLIGLLKSNFRFISEIDDARFNVSNSDKAFSKAFYGGRP